MQTKPPARYGRHRKPRTHRAWSVVAKIATTIIFLGGVSAAGLAIHMLQGLPSVQANTFTNPYMESTVYDVHGQVIGTFARDGARQPIESLAEVSPKLTQAFVAAEDKTFYSNMGINPVAMMRALWQNATRHRIESGASTITQQTVKLAVFPNQERTLKRKVQEIAIALQVSHLLTKEEIMTDYMNWVYMGKMGPQNVYGVKTAAQILFHRDPRDLTLGQATVIASIPNNPSLFSPYEHPKHVRQRQQYILDQMLRHQMITSAQYARALSEPVFSELQRPPASRQRYPYIMSTVERDVVTQLVAAGLFNSRETADVALASSGYRIHTTIDLARQKHLDQVLSNKRWFFRSNKRGPDGKSTDLYQAGVVVIDNATGGITALGGGRPDQYDHDEIDHTDIPRQPGSVIKPLLVYGPALEKGQITPASRLMDGPAVFDEGLPWAYEPKDDQPWWHGMVSVRRALVQSLNLPALRVLHDLRPETGTTFLARMGIRPGDVTDVGQPTLTVPDTHHLSIGIGGLTYGLTLRQLTSAYTVFPNQGIWREPTLVSKVADKTGGVIWAANPQAHRVFSPSTAFIMTDLLRDVVQSPIGTARSVGYAFPHAFIAGKTGTTDGDSDGWFIGYTPKFTMGIWTGYNHNQTIPDSIYGVKFRLWNAIAKPMIASERPIEPSAAPANLMPVRICKVSGHVATAGCEASGTDREEWFVRGSEPTTQCEVHVGASESMAENQTATGSSVWTGGVTAMVSDSGVVLTWQAGDASALYSVWRSDKPTGPFRQVGSPSPLTVFADTSAPANTTVYYQVRIEQGDGLAVPSNVVKVKTTPPPTAHPSPNGDDGGPISAFPWPTGQP